VRFRLGAHDTPKLVPVCKPAPNLPHMYSADERRSYTIVIRWSEDINACIHACTYTCMHQLGRIFEMIYLFLIQGKNIQQQAFRCLETRVHEAHVLIYEHQEWHLCTILKFIHEHQVLVPQGKYAEAIAMYETALSSPCPECERDGVDAFWRAAVLRRAKAECLRRAGDLPAAIEELSGLLALFPRFEAALLELALSALDAGRPATAIKLLEKLHKLDRDWPALDDILVHAHASLRRAQSSDDQDARMLPSMQATDEAIQRAGVDLLEPALYGHYQVTCPALYSHVYVWLRWPSLRKTCVVAC
jgi:tetratricopeptide (TPR) repeat protein